MTNKDFEKKLKRLNSKIRLIPGKLEASGVYIHQPRHPDSYEGLTHVGGYPTPKHFPKIPQWNFRTYEFLTSEGDPRIVHGWNEVVHHLIGAGMFGSGRAKKAFPSLRLGILSHRTKDTAVYHKKTAGYHRFFVDEDKQLFMDKK